MCDLKPLHQWSTWCAKILVSNREENWIDSSGPRPSLVTEKSPSLVSECSWALVLYYWFAELEGSRQGIKSCSSQLRLSLRPDRTVPVLLESSSSEWSRLVIGRPTEDEMNNRKPLAARDLPARSWNEAVLRSFRNLSTISPVMGRHFSPQPLLEILGYCVTKLTSGCFHSSSIPSQESE